MKISIRLKFLFVMCGLLVLCLGTYVFMAFAVFKSDKTELVFDLNRSQVSNLASEIETGLNGVSEQLKLFAQLPASLQNKMIEQFLSNDSEIVSVAIYKTGTEKPFQVHTQAQFLETYGLKMDAWKNQIENIKVPFKDILQDGEGLWNASIENQPPLIGYGRLVILENVQGIPIDQWTVVGYVKLDRFIKSLSIVNLNEIIISNNRGEVLVQKDIASLFKKPNISDDPLFLSSEKEEARLKVTKVKYQSQNWLAASAKAFKGHILVIARAPEKEVFRVVQELSTRTFLFGSIVLTLVILAAFLLSSSLTKNIAHLAQRMLKVSEGDLSTEIHLKGRDETVELAKVFNKMISDLQQSRNELEIINRDLDLKVKERTAQLEAQNRKVQEAQEALIRTTRLASVGEIAGRAAHEVLNPLTSLLTRAGLMQQRTISGYKEQINLIEEITTAWQNDISDGGIQKLLTSWNEPSSIEPSKTLLEEDIQNLQDLTKELATQGEHINDDTEFIREEGNRIGRIINSMRRLGHVQNDIREHSLHTILSDCCHIMVDLFAQKNFEIEKIFIADKDLVSVDRDEIIQAVTNLMRNSLQSLIDSGKNTTTKKILTIRTSVSNNHIFVDIEDNGVGITFENQEKLFESSFTTKSPDEGTGLGLSISRRFIRNYGGDIELVSSLANEKTIFRISIPLKTQQQGVAA